jgi:beta-galactosidase/beta-glucuronidase
MPEIKSCRFHVPIICIVIFFSIIFYECEPENKKGTQFVYMDQPSIRKIKVLEENWRFQPDINNIGENEHWFDKDLNNWGKVTVPQAWDCIEEALWGYEGIGWYTTIIGPDDFVAGKITEITFDRVMYYSKVWLNGEYLGENIGGYLPFSFDITSRLKPGQDNKLVLRVDNKPRIEWLPASAQIEWMQYGGILGPVKLVSKSQIYIDDLVVTTNPDKTGARINCLISIANKTLTKDEVQLEIKIAGRSGIINKKMNCQCKPEQTGKFSVDLTLEHAELWSPESPVLYTAMASLVKSGTTLDDLSCRIGIRKVSVEGSSILLNGKPVTIKGVNRYDEYGKFGPNVPEKLLREELALMKSVGINTIRVHYPQSPYLLSLYDEYGFLMIEEVPLNWWGWFGGSQSLSILDQAKPALRKIIARDKNHPCVIIWSMGNECATDNETGITVMRELLKLAKSLDPTRLATFVVALDPAGHLAYDEADVVCINKYNGIFSGKNCEHIDEIDSLGYKPLVKELTQHLNTISKPVIITEYGAQGIKDIHGDVRYSEEFQAAYIEQIWKGIRSVPGVSGGVLWCWADYYHRKYLITYTNFGPYGVVTVDRKPKKSLDALTRMYGGPELKNN